MTNKRIAVILAVIAVIISGFLTAKWLEKPSLPKTEGIVIEVVAENLVVPWSIDFLPDGRIIFTERGGRINVVNEDVVTMAEIDVAAVGEGGLLGIAVAPEFAENSFVYVYYTYKDNGDLLNKVVRFKMIGLELVDETVVLDKIPGARFHNGGRIKFGPDDKLYITTGDALEPTLAQDVSSLAGKILRINKDGSIPEDNPFGNEVYSYGHRNPQGLAWHPVTGELYSTEHGATRNDEVNIIKPGRNYGWPIVECDEGEGYEAPLVCFSQVTVAPSGATFYSGDKLPWKNSLFFASLRGQHLHRIAFDNDYRTVLEQEILLDAYGRIRDVVQYNGYLYLATSNRDGRGTPKVADDKIIRISGGTPPTATPTPQPVKGEVVRVAEGSYLNISAAQLHSMLQQKDFLLINVHIPYQGEIAGTDLFIPFDKVEQNLAKLPTDKGAKIVVYCRSGGMSAISAEVLVGLGYTNVWNLKGGMVEWQIDDYPLINNPK